MKIGREFIKQIIEGGDTSLGIEFGSTRIKAVLIGKNFETIATGSHQWENRLKNGFWTYNLPDIITGMQTAYENMRKKVEQDYDITIETVGSIGISAMMHGYMAFDAAGDLLVPFRTWRNATTGTSAKILTDQFQFNIPERWSIAHLYQGILDEEKHLAHIDYMTTLSGYIHWLLTGRKAIGVGDASGMFPVNESTGDYNEAMLAKFDELISKKAYVWKLKDILPEVYTAGDQAGG